MSATGHASKPSEGTYPVDNVRKNSDAALTSPSLDSAASPATQRSPTFEDGPGNSFNVTAKKTAVRLSHAATTKDAREPKNVARAASPAVQPPAAVDPLSQHIFMRTNTDHTIPQRLRNPARPDSPILEQPDGSEPPTKPPAQVIDVGKDKKKGVSFLSRLSMRGARKKGDDTNDDESEVSEQRLDGNNAPVFSSSVASGFIPHHKEPPRYVRVKAHSKKTREFDRMFLAQQLVAIPAPLQDDTQKSSNTTVPISGAGKRGSKGGGAVWAAEFSTDGRYLAAAGRDQVVRVWAVISTPEERRSELEEEEFKAAASSDRLNAPVFRSKPVREFAGHSGEVLDLSWSKNNFLLSSSMDKTVRLWHMSRAECLCTFKHKDFVTSISFHPKDDRFFLAGSLDSTLRLWSIPDKSVAFSVQLPDLVTAVGFSPDGQTSIAGVLSGLCLFYETHGLKYHTQIHVRSSRGKNAKGSKITGIQTTTMPAGQEDGDVKVLITSNDSRIRIYNLRDKSLEVKFKGHENTCSQLHAGFSDDAQYVICGSEDRKAFVWSVSATDSENKDKGPCEFFDAHAGRVTAAAFAPTRLRQLLGASGDPIYDLCNPPPVTLLSKEEATASQSAFSEEQSFDLLSHVKKPEESPAYIARSTHHDGNIIITADQMGIIKVFRQDCAYLKRRHENWEMGSTFSKKLASSGGLIGRSGSIATRTSASSRAHSRRGSLSQPGSVVGAPTATPQLSSDRIISWRQGIESGRSGSLGGTPSRSERSLSPAKGGRTPINTSVANLASEARKQPYATSSPNARSVMPTSPTSSIHTTRTGERANGKDGPSQPPTPSFSFRSLDDENDDARADAPGGAPSFWNLSRWRGISSLRTSTASSPQTSAVPTLIPSSLARSYTDAMASVSSSNAGTSGISSRRKSMGIGTASHVAAETGDLSRRKSFGDSAKSDGGAGSQLSPRDGVFVRQASFTSRLSSDLTSEDGEAMTCTKCGGMDFKVKKVAGKQRFLCGKCGKLAEEEVKP